MATNRPPRFYMWPVSDDGTYTIIDRGRHPGGDDVCEAWDGEVAEALLGILNYFAAVDAALTLYPKKPKLPGRVDGVTIHVSEPDPQPPVVAGYTREDLQTAWEAGRQGRPI